MNRFYLFNTWVLIFFIVLTALFFVASCFYLFQLYNLDKKNRKRFKKQTPDPEGQRKRTYERNLKLAAKLEANEILATAVSKPELKSKPPKKVKRNAENAKTRSSLCFDALFRPKKKKSQTQPGQYSPKEDSYFSEIQTYVDQLDGQAQSYESFETMTTDSECYRDWRHSIDFMSNGVLSLNHYNQHNNEIMQRAYEQLYAQRHRTSTSSLCKPPKDEVSIPVTDLYPVSVEPIVPYEYEPQSIHAYQLHAQVHNDEEAAYRRIANRKADDDLVQNVQKEKCKALDEEADDQRNESKLESDADSKPAGPDISQPNNLNDHNEKNKVTKRSVNETINKLSTLVSVRNDGKIKQKVLSDTDSKSNLDRNMNLLKSESSAVQM